MSLPGQGFQVSQALGDLVYRGRGFVFNEEMFYAIFLKQFHRVLPRMDGPENIHIQADKFGLGLRDEQIKECPVDGGNEFAAVIVIEERDALLGESFTGLVENGGGFAGGFLGEQAIVRNPRHADKLNAEGFRPTLSEPVFFVERIAGG